MKPEWCCFWDCGDIDSPFTRDHARKPGETGICTPRRRACSLETGESVCGMFMEKGDNHDE